MTDGERAERLGEIIRRQRELSALSMRQFADLVGISNPYLSQIERGLREPSERVLEGIAKSLSLSVDALREQAGLHVDDEEETPPVVEAIRADAKLTGRQRQGVPEEGGAARAHAERTGAGGRRPHEVDRPSAAPAAKGRHGRSSSS